MKEIKEYLSKGDIDKAIIHLKKTITNKETIDQLSLLEFRNHEIDKEYRLGIITADVKDSKKNKLVLDILKLVDNEKKPLKVYQSKSNLFVKVLVVIGVIGIILVFRERIIGKTDPNEIVFRTNQLMNEDFIFTTGKWPFEVDSLGEDVMSQYSPGVVRNTRVSLYPFKSNEPTIANDSLQIRFQVSTSSRKKYYIDNVFLSIIENYDRTENMYLNTWEGKFEEHAYSVNLLPTKVFYQVSTDLIQLNRKNPEHFNLKVYMDRKRFKDQIVRFKIVLNLHLDSNEKLSLESDKSYYIAAFNK